MTWLHAISFVYCTIGLSLERLTGEVHMVSIGSKALTSRRPKTCTLTEDNSMVGEDNSYGRWKKDTKRKASKGHLGLEGDHPKRSSSGWGPDGGVKPGKPFKNKHSSEPQTSRLRFLFLILLLV